MTTPRRTPLFPTVDAMDWSHDHRSLPRPPDVPDRGRRRRRLSTRCRELEKAGVGGISRLPVSLRIVLESVLRNLDGQKITEEDVRALANWKPNAERTEEIPFVVARILLQDFTGVPLLVDLAAMRSAVERAGQGPRASSSRSCPSISSSTTRCRWTSGPRRTLSQRNMEMEFKRNRARYQFLKWGMQAFDGFDVVPPGIGIVPPGQPRVPRQRRLGEERRVLSRHARRHRLAHHDDQRLGHRRLGRGRHRGRGRDARPAGLFPDARRRRRPHDGPARRRRDGDRPGPALHGDAARREGRREVRRVSRRGRRFAAADRPRDHRQHVARVRRDDGLLPDRRGDLQLPARDRAAARSRSRPSEITSRRRACSACRGAASATTRSSSSSISARSAERRRTQAAAGPHRAAGPEGHVSSSCWRSRSRRTATARRTEAGAAASRRRSGSPERRRRRRSREAAARTRQPVLRPRARHATPTSGPRPKWSTTGRRRTASRRSPRSTSLPASWIWATATC